MADETSENEPLAGVSPEEFRSLLSGLVSDLGDDRAREAMDRLEGDLGLLARVNGERGESMFAALADHSSPADVRGVAARHLASLAESRREAARTLMQALIGDEDLTVGGYAADTLNADAFDSIFSPVERAEMVSDFFKRQSAAQPDARRGAAPRQ